MSTLQLTNSTNSIVTTGVFFAGVSPIDYTMLWDLDPQNKSLKEKKVFFQNYIVILDQSYFRFFELETLPILPKPKFRISSELASIKAELAKRRAAGAFEKNISLANRFAKPGVSYSDEEIQETLREIRSQWEEDLDDLNGQG